MDTRVTIRLNDDDVRRLGVLRAAVPRGPFLRSLLRSLEGPEGEPASFSPEEFSRAAEAPLLCTRHHHEAEPDYAKLLA